MAVTSTSSLQARSASLVRFPFEFLHFFLRESLFCWILDGDLQFAAPKQTHDLSLLPSSEEHVPSYSLETLCQMAAQVRTDFQTLEQKLALDKSRQPTLSLELSSLDGHSCTRGSSSAPASALPFSTHRRKRHEIRPDFQDFCDKLLEAQRLREQEKEIKRLQCALKASKKARSRSAFDTFCQEVLLTTELSKKRREVRELREEVELAKLERTDVDVKPEDHSHEDRLAERAAWDASAELVDERRSVELIREEHERELLEVTNDWRKENTMLRKELELLKLSQATRSLEQEISNELEQRLFEQRHLARGWSPADPSLRGKATADDGYSTDETDIELENMTTMSSSSTCVGSPSPSPRKNAKRVSSYSRKAEPRGFAGFSFNPLYYGADGALSKRRNSTLTSSLVSRPPWRG